MADIRPQWTTNNNGWFTKDRSAFYNDVISMFNNCLDQNTAEMNFIRSKLSHRSTNLPSIIRSFADEFTTNLFYACRLILCYAYGSNSSLDNWPWSNADPKNFDGGAQVLYFPRTFTEFELRILRYVFVYSCYTSQRSHMDPPYNYGNWGETCLASFVADDECYGEFIGTEPKLILQRNSGGWFIDCEPIKDKDFQIESPKCFREIFILKYLNSYCASVGEDKEGNTIYGSDDPDPGQNPKPNEGVDWDERLKEICRDIYSNKESMHEKIDKGKIKARAIKMIEALQKHSTIRPYQTDDKMSQEQFIYITAKSMYATQSDKDPYKIVAKAVKLYESFES